MFLARNLHKQLGIFQPAMFDYQRVVHKSPSKPSSDPMKNNNFPMDIHYKSLWIMALPGLSCPSCLGGIAALTYRRRIPTRCLSLQLHQNPNESHRLLKKWCEAWSFFKRMVKLCGCMLCTWCNAMQCDCTCNRNCHCNVNVNAHVHVK